MNRLFLLRHAKAVWAAPGVADFDRPLEASGRDDARRVGKVLAARRLKPGRVLSSSAMRTVETWQNLLPVNDGSAQTFNDERIYSADAPELLAIIREQDFAGDLMVVGHNPTMEDMAEAFAVAGTSEARDWLDTGFPTCGFAMIELDGPFSDIEPGQGRLALAFGPADLQSASG